jgi:NAD(P)-dependent dehydrogenase (short-subunit alcohol dehydrogenase family)
MTNTLITGANKGLGYETARRLIDNGHRVYLGARDSERGQHANSARTTSSWTSPTTQPPAGSSVAAAAEEVGRQAGLLRKSSAAVIVNVSSGLGSFAAVHDPSRIEYSVPGALYQASKPR